jgi:transcriptional antiterminator NusG
MREVDAIPEKNWYIVHTYAGMEKKAKTFLEQKIETSNMQDYIIQIIIPEVEKEEVSKTKKKIKKNKRLYPGYILVEMIATKETIDFVRTTPGITGFVTLGKKPVPIEQKELDEIFLQMGIVQRNDKSADEIEFEVGEKVRILEGPFADSYGTIKEIDQEKGKVKLSVNIFNRETTVEVFVNQIEEV